MKRRSTRSLLGALVAIALPWLPWPLPAGAQSGSLSAAVACAPAITEACFDRSRYHVAWTLPESCKSSTVGYSVEFLGAYVNPENEHVTNERAAFGIQDTPLWIARSSLQIDFCEAAPCPTEPDAVTVRVKGVGASKDTSARSEPQGGFSDVVAVAGCDVY